MKKQEIEKCISKYFYDENANSGKVEIPFTRQKEIQDLLNIIRNFNNLIVNEEPDGFIVMQDYILILEHFEIDATKRNRKGSQTRIQENIIENKINQTTNTLVSMQMQVNISTNNLIDNFRQIYVNHFNKIENYKKNLISKGIGNQNTKFKICFFIEDVTPMGTFYLNNNQRTKLRITDIKECVEILQSNTIDYIFCFNEYDNDKDIYFAQKEWLNDILTLAKNGKDIKMLDWQPIVLGANYLIPKI